MKRKQEQSSYECNNTCIMKIFTGGSNSVQSLQFFSALNELTSEYYQKCGLVIVQDKISVEDIRKRRWSIQNFVSWLRSGDIYFILSHPGQGISIILDWDLGILGDELFHGLDGCLGFPSGDSIRCPVFTQDKYRYLHACRRVCLPTLKITRTSDGTMSENDQEAVLRFCGKHFELPNEMNNLWNCKDGERLSPVGGWVLKAPFTTNSKGVTFCLTRSSIFAKFRQLCFREELLNVPYFMLQPRLVNRMEYKVILGYNDIQETPFRTYFARNHIRSGQRKAFAEKRDLFAFAHRAKSELLSSFPSSVCSPLLRVDIMITQHGKLVVNEFESLEAMHDYSGQVQPDGEVASSNTDSMMADFRRMYWLDRIRILVEKHCSKFD